MPKRLYFPEEMDFDVARYRVDLEEQDGEIVPVVVRYDYRNYGRLARRELIEAVEAENSFYEETEQNKARRRKHREARKMEHTKHNGYCVWNKAKWVNACNFPDRREKRIKGRINDIVRDNWTEIVWDNWTEILG